jgi:hypothetical protein
MSTGTIETSLPPSTAAAMVAAVARYTAGAAEAGHFDTHHTNAAAEAAARVVEGTDTHILLAAVAGVEGTHRRYHTAHIAKAGEVVANAPRLVEAEEVAEGTVAAANTGVENPVAVQSLSF